MLHIEPQRDFEAALFDYACDVIMEHIEYLHTEAAIGKKVTLFCAPQTQRGLKLIVPLRCHPLENLKGKTIAVRDLGRPHRITLWLGKVGLEKFVETIIVPDQEVGRRQQWRKVVSGECSAGFMAPIYLPAALAAGLKTFPATEAEIVSLFAQACLVEFGRNNAPLMKDYLKAVIHAIALLICRRDQAMEIIVQEPMQLMKITDSSELRRQIDSIAELMQVKPYPASEAILNTGEVATQEYGPTVENPLTLWDLHWLKELGDENGIDKLVASFS